MGNIGVISFGVKTPFIKEGDSLLEIVPTAAIQALDELGFKVQLGDIICITESLLARSQGNFATTDDVARDVVSKFGENQDIGVVFPIFSRNRFAPILEGIAKGAGKVYVQLGYPSDEQGNALWDNRKATKTKNRDISGIYPNFELEIRNAYGDEEGKCLHSITGMDYMEYYRSLGENIIVIPNNNPRSILNYTNNVIVANVHGRNDVREDILLASGGKATVYTLADMLNTSVTKGYNPEYGLLGSNSAADGRLKLFPRGSNEFVSDIQSIMLLKTGVAPEVLVYGDGAFKDPVTGIWELADPIVCPGYTDGLIGSPNEVKLKMLIDQGLTDEQIMARISAKDHTSSEMLGTTPRQITDLVGSLADLTSGSGDRGTPVVYVKNFLTNKR